MLYHQDSLITAGGFSKINFFNIHILSLFIYSVYKNIVVLFVLLVWR